MKSPAGDIVAKLDFPGLGPQKNDSFILKV
jgi:hypothetical protein